MKRRFTLVATGLLLTLPVAAQTSKKKKAAVEPTVQTPPRTAEPPKAQGATLEEAKAFIVSSIETCSNFSWSIYTSRWANLDNLGSKCFDNDAAFYEYNAGIAFSGNNIKYVTKTKPGKYQIQWEFYFNMADIDFNSLKIDGIGYNDRNMCSLLIFTLKPGKQFINSVHKYTNDIDNQRTLQNKNFIAILFNEPTRADRVKKAFLRINELMGGGSVEEKF